MKLSEELIYRGFKAETTIENPEDLDTRESKKFYWGGRSVSGFFNDWKFGGVNDVCVFC